MMEIVRKGGKDAQLFEVSCIAENMKNGKSKSFESNLISAKPDRDYMEGPWDTRVTVVQRGSTCTFPYRSPMEPINEPGLLLCCSSEDEHRGAGRHSVHLHHDNVKIPIKTT